MDHCHSLNCKLCLMNFTKSSSLCFIPTPLVVISVHIVRCITSAYNSSSLQSARAHLQLHCWSSILCHVLWCLLLSIQFLLQALHLNLPHLPPQLFSQLSHSWCQLSAVPTNYSLYPSALGTTSSGIGNLCNFYCNSLCHCNWLAHKTQNFSTIYSLLTHLIGIAMPSINNFGLSTTTTTELPIQQSVAIPILSNYGSHLYTLQESITFNLCIGGLTSLTMIHLSMDHLTLLQSTDTSQGIESQLRTGMFSANTPICSEIPTLALTFLHTLSMLIAVLTFKQIPSITVKWSLMKLQKHQPILANHGNLAKRIKSLLLSTRIGTSYVVFLVYSVGLHFPKIISGYCSTESYISFSVVTSPH